MDDLGDALARASTCSTPRGVDVSAGCDRCGVEGRTLVDVGGIDVREKGQAWRAYRACPPCARDLEPRSVRKASQLALDLEVRRAG